MTDFKQREKRRRVIFWVALSTLFVGMLALSVWWMGSPPPNHIVLATGDPSGAYAAFGKKYQDRLGRMGLGVEVRNTKGSVENLHLLLEHKADVAFVQGGTYQLVDDPNGILRGLASVYLEPLWVFYRVEKVNTMSDLRGHSISIGPDGSGTEAVGRQLLREHGITPENSKILNFTLSDAKQKLKDGSLEAALFVSSYQDTGIQELLKRDDIKLMDFRRDVAYSRRFPYLTPVKLAEGLIDLRDNSPPEEKTLLAPAAMLVCREDLHPRVIEQILGAAQIIHAPGSLMDAPKRFPSLEGMDVPAHTMAETYMKSGESMLARLLPYWGVRLVLQLRVLLLPVLAVWLPFLKIVPMVYRYRINNLLKRHYAALRDMESGLRTAGHSEELRARLQSLEHLSTDMESLSRKVPAAYQRDLYEWRLHVAMVRAEAAERLQRMELPSATAS